LEIIIWDKMLTQKCVYIYYSRKNALFSKFETPFIEILNTKQTIQ